MPILWQSLLINLAIIAVLMMFWEMLIELIGELPRRSRGALLGTVMGFGAIVSMLVALPIGTGHILDLRTAMISATTLIGGPVAGGVAAVLSAVCRLIIGGPGTMPGLASIVISFGVAAALYATVRRRRRRWWHIALLTILVPLAGLAAYLFAPYGTRLALLLDTALPYSLLNGAAILLASSVLHRIETRRDMIRRNQAYATMVENLPDCLNLKDLDGRFVIANTATARLMKARSAQALIGKTDFDFYPTDLAKTFRAEETAVMESGEPMKIEQRFVTRSGQEGWLATLKAPLFDETGAMIGLITHNREITAEKRAAEVKNQFVSTVSHELRTPLTAIRGAMGLLAGGVLRDVPPQARKLIDIASSNSERLVELINDILDMERIELGKMQLNLESQPLRPVVDQSVADMVNYLPEREIRIVVDDRTPGALARIDGGRMKQVLANLISNAIKFADAGSTVTVTLSHQPDTDTQRISVHNAGAPIPEDFRARIFQKFERSEETNTRKHGGTGLGLSIARSLVKHMQGELWFESAEGEGTVFHVDLPRPPGAALPFAPPPEPAKPHEKPHVLVVESDEKARHIICDALEHSGLEPEVATTLEAARRAMEQATFDAVLLDLDLVEDEMERLFADLKRTRPKLPVIVVAAEADAARRKLVGQTVTVADWIPRPVDSARVAQAVQDICERIAGGTARVLHVEDDLDVLTVIREQFEDDIEIWHAKTLREALDLVARHYFDAVILDIALPDGSGLDLLPRLHPDTDIVVFSALDVEIDSARPITKILTKTRTEELDVARTVKRILGRAA